MTSRAERVLKMLYIIITKKGCEKKDFIKMGMKTKTVNKDILLMRDCGIIEYDSKINKWILRRSIL